MPTGHLTNHSTNRTATGTANREARHRPKRQKAAYDAPHYRGTTGGTIGDTIRRTTKRTTKRTDVVPEKLCKSLGESRQWGIQGSRPHRSRVHASIFFGLGHAIYSHGQARRGFHSDFRSQRQ